MLNFFSAAVVGILLLMASDDLVAQDPSVAAVLSQQEKDRIADLERQANVDLPDTEDKQELCILFHKRGMANSKLGRYGQAVNDLRQALHLNQPNRLTPNNWGDRWRIQNDLSSTLSDAGDHLARIEHLKAVGTELRQANARLYFFSQLTMLDSYIALGMLKEAEEVFRRASETLPELRSRRDWTTEQYNTMDMFSRYSAWLQELRGNYQEAERFRRTALDNARQYLNAMLRMFAQDSQDVRIARGNVTGTTRHLAANLVSQGKLGEAEYLAHDALSQTLSQSSFNTTGTSNALSTLAAIQMQQGKVAAAARYMDLAIQALGQSSVKPYSPLLAGRRAQMGFTLGVQNRWGDALGVFEARDQGLRSSPEQFAKTGSRHMDWAMALLKNRHASKAADMLKRLVDFNLKKPFVDPVYMAHLHGYLGMALVEQGNNSQALTEFQAALPVLLKLARDNAGNEDSGFIKAYRLRLILEGYLELLARLHVAGQPIAGTDLVTEAFRIADIARNSSVQRAVTASAARASIPDARLAQLARREQDATNQMLALNKILVRLASAPEGQRLHKIVEDMRQDIERLAAEQIKLRKEIAEQFPDYADLVDPQPATPADLQRVLAADEAVISVYSGERQAFVWTITNNEVAFRIVPVAREQLAQDVASLRRSIDLTDGEIRDFDTAAAHRLYAVLLANDASKWSAAKLVNVIPHSILGQVPFGMLVTEPVKPAKGKTTPAYGDMPWLIKKVAIAQQASASGFVALRRAAAGKSDRLPFIGFGDPLFIADVAPAKRRGTRVRNLEMPPARDETLNLIGQAQQSGKPLDDAKAASRPTLAQAFALLAPLPDTAEELKEIAQTMGADPQNDVFLGRRATESSLKAADLSRYRVVAFATHGLVPGELSGLDQPALAMANPALTKDTENDGFLTLEEVLSLKLNAEWVVLSACNTASADGSASEAVSGLGRGFFYAGARSLLVSNWAVETVSARLLTTGLFQQQATNPGMPRAEALRQSMLKLVNNRESDYGHPAFWAPFSLVGDGLKH